MAEQGPLTGQTLGGKYLLGELLGEGGFGMVYAGQHLLLSRPQAIKLLLERHFRQPKFRERFQQEARMVAALDHPHIVHIDDFEIEEQENRAYLVMPFLTGGTFQQILSQARSEQRFLEMERVVSYAEQVSLALDYAHKLGVVHLDLKPLNLLIHDGKLLLADFGLAHLLKQEQLEGGTSLKYGTPYYMAPEHIRGNPGKQSDVYAFGIMLYQMLAGRLPFEGKGLAVMAQHLSDPLPPLYLFRTDVPPELERVLQRALAKEPAQRYQSAGELLEAFREALTKAQERVRQMEEERQRQAEEERLRKLKEEQLHQEAERRRQVEKEQLRKAEEERLRKEAEEQEHRGGVRNAIEEERLRQKIMEDEQLRHLEKQVPLVQDRNRPPQSLGASPPQDELSPPNPVSIQAPAPPSPLVTNRPTPPSAAGQATPSLVQQPATRISHPLSPALRTPVDTPRPMQPPPQPLAFPPPARGVLTPVKSAGIRHFVLLGISGLTILALLSGVAWLSFFPAPPISRNRVPVAGSATANATTSNQITPTGNSLPTPTTNKEGTSSGTITEFPVPTSASQPQGITAGPDGNLWFTEWGGNKIGRISPSGTFTEFPLPTAYSGPHEITTGPDGSLWFTELIGNKIGRISTNGTITEFLIPGRFQSEPQGITAGPDGNLWFTEGSGNKIGRISPSGTITEFLIPTGATGAASSTPFRIIAGPDGNLWFTEYQGNKIGRISPSGTITEFPLPTSTSQPSGITAGPDGNLWFTEGSGNKIGRISTNGTITEFPVPTSTSQPSEITAGPDGNLWFIEDNKIGRISPSGTITEFPLPTSTSQPSEITAGADGNLWFTDSTDKIRRITSGKQQKGKIS